MTRIARILGLAVLLTQLTGVSQGVDGPLSPLQAQVDLALAPNRGLRDTIIRIDLNGLRQAGFEIPSVSQVPRDFGMPGGGTQIYFPYSIPRDYVTVVRP
jgi:hypothetical protein